ncbi:hypothetical protein EV178_000447 [Coemansia sp. RSA 1646]|nr:hypothetical protein EV178_000447 [Coemansia sp. RSA 1646]KAJ2093745.1 hypothetical protein IW138_000141 [Coemansia sp. RSA 986]
MEDAALQLPSLGTVLSKVEINSTEDLTKALRSTALPLEHRLTLAWTIFDSSKVEGESATIDKLCAILVRKDDLLAEWLFSTILRELKASKANQYTLSKDPRAIRLLGCVLENMKYAQSSTAPLDIRTVLQGPVMPLFVNAFAGEASAKSAAHVRAITKVWRFVVESTSDGLETILARPDMLAQLISSAAAFYLEAIGTGNVELQESLLAMITSASHAMRVVCESSLNPRKMFLLFDSKALLPVFELVSKTQAHSAAQRKVLDMLHAGLFHAECMSRLSSTLMGQLPDTSDGDQSYVQQLFDVITSMMDPKGADSPTKYVAVLPRLFSRYLQASALICLETRNMAANTLGLSAIVATPRTVSKAESCKSCFAMFSYLYNLLRPLCRDEIVLVSLNQLVDVYFRDPCFGTASSARFADSDVYKSQINMLDSWLTGVIEPVILSPDASTASIAAAFAGVDLTLDAGPEIAQAHGDTLLGAFLQVPLDAAEEASRVLEHWVSTLAKARQLDTLFDRIARLQVGGSANSPQKRNLLLDAYFLRALNLAVSQLMPFAQIGGCLSALVDAIVTKTTALSTSEAQVEGSSRKRRRTTNGVKSIHASGSANDIEFLATIAANFVLSSVTTISTEHQRASFGSSLVSKLDELRAALVSDDFAWERLLLHYVFVEAGSRIDGMERWLESCMYPAHVSKSVLPRCIRKKNKMPQNPRISAIAMLVVFQTATHWAVFVSSAGAGIIPDSVTSAVDINAVTVTMSQMVSTFVSSDSLSTLSADKAAKEKKTAELTDSKDGWNSWDGQAHTISDSNCKGAQWRLILDWIELICEYADDASIHAIALRIVDGFARARTDEPDAKSQMLLRSASFFEISKIRDVLALVLAEYAAGVWKAQMSELKASSDSSSEPQLVLDFLTSIHNATSKGATKKYLLQETIVMIASKLTDKSQKRHQILTNDQALLWIRLLRAVVQFPAVYWTSEQARVIFALALVVDLGIANICANTSDGLALQAVGRKIMEQLLEHAPSLSLLLAEHIQSIVDSWAVSIRLSDKLLLSSRRMLYLVVGALTQASFMQSSSPANTACRGLCIHLFGKLNQTGLSDTSVYEILIMDTFNAVAGVAKKCARKMQPDRRSEWVALVEPWEDKLVHSVQTKLGSIGNAETVDDLYATCCLGVLISLQSISSSLGEADSVSKNGSNLTAQTLGSLGKIAQYPGIFGLGLVIRAIHSSSTMETNVPDIFSFLIRHLSARGRTISSDQRLIHSLQSVIAAIAGTDATEVGCPSMHTFIASYAVEPLLKSLDCATFEATLVTTIKLSQQFGQSTAAVASAMLLAYVHTGYKQSGGDNDIAQKRKAVQKRLGNTLAALHASLNVHPSTESALHVLNAANEMLLEPTMRFTTYDISEALGIVFSVITLPFNVNSSVATNVPPQEQISELYCLVCKVLSSIVRYHTDRVLDVVSLLVKTLRALIHAFVLPAFPRRLAAATGLGIDVGSTPWIVAYAPFNVRCAESYARVLDDLVRSRRLAKDPTRIKGKKDSHARNSTVAADGSGYVKLTRGTNAAGAASVIGLYAPYILAEYCIIQGGGALSAISSRALGRGSAENASDSSAFSGLGWRPTLVLASDGDGSSSNVLPFNASDSTHNGSSSGARGTISSIAVQEALVPGLHALLDVMSNENRSTLLALLAGPSNDAGQGSATGWSSIFGPDRYGGASEILKSLHKSYLNFYKYSGQV